MKHWGVHLAIAAIIIGYPITLQVSVLTLYSHSILWINTFSIIVELQLLLNEDFFGQHIATDIVSRQIEAHLSNVNPSKPLVMSFHGWTGNGKNHMAYLIAKSLYRSEVNSPFYHHFMATVHFPHQVKSKSIFLLKSSSNTQHFAFHRSMRISTRTKSGRG